MDDDVPYDDEFSEMESTSEEDDNNEEEIDESKVCQVGFSFLRLIF